MAYRADLEPFDCGVDLVVDVQLYDGDTGTVEQDLTGILDLRYRLSEQLHPGKPVLIEKTIGAGIAIIGPPVDGFISITFAAEDTLTTVGGLGVTEVSRLTGIYEHELRLTDSAGNVTALFTGRATINPTGPV